MIKIRRWLQRQMPSAKSALENGTFTISAEFRAANRGTRWKVIGRWSAGESLPAALDRIAIALRKLPREEPV
jgi:hypothetical protein